MDIPMRPSTSTSTSHTHTHTHARTQTHEQEAIEAVSGMRDAREMARRLVNMSIDRGTTDNVSCMVVRLHE